MLFIVPAMDFMSSAVVLVRLLTDTYVSDNVCKLVSIAGKSAYFVFRDVLSLTICQGVNWIFENNFEKRLTFFEHTNIIRVWAFSLILSYDARANRCVAMRRTDMTGFVKAEDMAVRWDVSVRQVQLLCQNGKIEGASKFGNVWAILKTLRNLHEHPRLNQGVV